MKTKYSSTAKTQTTEFWYLPRARVNEEAGAYIGRVARFARQCFGLSQQQIAGFPQSYVSRLENGKWQSIKKANQYLLGFGLSMGKFEFKK